MVKNYIVASVLLGSMLAGHAHAVTAPHATLRKLQQNNYGVEYADEYPSVDVVYGAVADPSEDLGTGLAPIDVVTGKRKLLNDEAEITGEEASASEFSAADFSGEHELSPVYEDVYPTLPVDEDSYSLDTYTVRDTGLAPIDFATGKRKLQQDNYGDWYDPYGVDTGDDYYSDGTGTLWPYADGYDDNYGDWYDPKGVDTDDDYYSDGDGYFYRYPAAMWGVVIHTADDASLPIAGGLLNGLGRKLQQDNYGDWYDPYGVDTDDGSRPATLRGKTTFHLKQSLQKERSSF